MVADPPCSPLRDRLRQQARRRAADGLARVCPPISQRDGVRYRIREQAVTGYCSNDYLGYGAQAFSLATTTSASSSAARLVCGDLPEHRAAELALAAWLEAEDAVLFPSGYQLNVSVPAALIEEVDAVYSDRLNHASLIDGLRLAAPKPRLLPHLGSPPAPSPEALNWWFCESIYSMDGDRTGVDALARFTQASGVTYVDEAHALGLFPGGRGLARPSSPASAEVIVAPLGKAFGLAGAFVASSAEVCDAIRTRARGTVFSTGTHPAIAAAIPARIAQLQGADGDDRRARLWENVACAAEHLDCAPSSAIFPLHVGDNATATRLADRLLRAGIHVQPIRPPTVPPGTARLRFTVSALHVKADLVRALETIAQAFGDEGLELRVRRGETAS